MPIDDSPRWVHGGVWNGTDLVLVDIRQRSMLRYRVDGSRAVLAGPVPHPPSGSLDFSLPLDLQPLAAGGYLLLDGLDRLLWLDSELRPSRDLRLPQDLDAPGVEVAGMPELTTVGDDVLGLFYQAGDQGHWRGWVRLEPATGKVTRLQEDDEDSRRARLNALTHPLVATAGGTAYALLHGDPPTLLALTDPPHRLSVFPPGPWRLPAVPAEGGPGTSVAAFRALAATPMPLALYGRGDFLYLLTRRRHENAPRWQLHQIDPRRDRLVRSLDLPTTAAHLFLVPGDDAWAVVEKGEVVRPGEQEVPSLLLIPAPWIEEPGAHAWPLTARECGEDSGGKP